MRVRKKKTVILACALSALLFVGCGKSAELANVSDAAPVESVAEEVKENVTETEEKDKETATSVSGNDENSEAADESALNENTTGEMVDGKNSEEKTGEASQATTQENAQANQDLQMVDGVDYSEWTKRQTWTASNGVTLKIKDYVDLNNLPGPGSDIIIDGNIHPDSPFMVAVNEYAGKTNLQDVPTELPVINNSSVKRTSFPYNDPVFLDYQTKVNQVLATQTGVGACGLYSDGAMTRTSDAMNNFWELSYTDSYWHLKIYRNMPTAVWDSLRDCIKLVSPDGQLLYDVIYTDFFEGSIYIQDYNMWCPVGGSEIYQPDCTNAGVIDYYFK